MTRRLAWVLLDRSRFVLDGARRSVGAARRARIRLGRRDLHRGIVARLRLLSGEVILRVAVAVAARVCLVVRGLLLFRRGFVLFRRGFLVCLLLGGWRCG
tara:strand:+ start:276 stop:575 length:300 start_codon:yes stop_codon:yes gene_type:complete